MRKQRGKRYLSKKSFTYEIYAGTSKAAHKVFQQGVCLLLGNFLFFKLAVLCMEIMAEDWVRLQLDVVYYGIYHFSAVVDFSSEKYSDFSSEKDSGSTGHRNS